MRLGALLSSDDFGSRVEREAHGQVLWRVHMQAADASAEWRGCVVDLDVPHAMADGKQSQLPFSQAEVGSDRRGQRLTWTRMRSAMARIGRSSIWACCWSSVDAASSPT